MRYSFCILTNDNLTDREIETLKCMSAFNDRPMTLLSVELSFPFHVMSIVGETSWFSCFCSFHFFMEECVQNCH